MDESIQAGELVWDFEEWAQAPKIWITLVLMISSRPGANLELEISIWEQYDPDSNDHITR